MYNDDGGSGGRWWWCSIYFLKSKVPRINKRDWTQKYDFFFAIISLWKCVYCTCMRLISHYSTMWPKKNLRFIYRQPKWSAFFFFFFFFWCVFVFKEAFSIKPSFSFVQQHIIYFYYISVWCVDVCVHIKLYWKL